MADTEQSATNDNSDSTATLRDMLDATEQGLRAGAAQLAQLRLQHSETLSQLKSAREQASDQAWELEELEQRLHDLQAQLAGSADGPREHELATMIAHRARLEEQALDQLFRVDELTKRHTSSEQTLTRYEQEWALQEAELLARRDQLIRNLQQADDSPEDSRRESHT